jgi:hypothetical protein
MTEAVVQAEILRTWGARPGLRLFRTNAGALADPFGRLIRYGIVGGSDITGILAPRGRWLAIECKATRGRQSEEQKAFERMVLAHGGVYLLVRTLEEASRGIRAALDEEDAITDCLRTGLTCVDPKLLVPGRLA